MSGDLRGDFLEHLPHKLGVRLVARSEEHTSELQSRLHLVCRLLLEKKKNCAEVDPMAQVSRATVQQWHTIVGSHSIARIAAITSCDTDSIEFAISGIDILNKVHVCT